MTTQPCWFLAPRACPLDGPIQLGNIIISPTQPDEPLFANSDPLPASEKVTEFVETGFNFQHGEPRKLRVGVWGSFLQLVLGVGADVSFSRTNDDNQTLTAREMRTRYFIPSEKYLTASVQQDAVGSYIRKSRFHGKLYMVTGVMEAVDAASCVSYMWERGVEMKLGLDGTAMGMPVSGGPAVEAIQGRNVKIGSKAANDFVFAFRLRQVKVKKGEVSEHKQHRKGALFDGDVSAEELEKMKEREKLVPVEVEGLTSADVTGEMVGMDTFDAFEDWTGAECLCVSPE